MTRDRLLAFLQSSPLSCSRWTANGWEDGVDLTWYFQAYRQLDPAALRQPEDSAGHYRRRAGELALSPNQAFDEFYYRTFYPEVDCLIKTGDLRTGWEHYLNRGIEEQKNPAWWFDEQWYRRRNPEVAEAVKLGRLNSGFEHYLMYGIHLDLSPSLYFDAAWYRQRYLASDRTTDSRVLPLRDYLLSADRSARCPVQFFDSEWYRLTYLEPELGDLLPAQCPSPYEYYIFHGRFQQHSPSPHFNERAYREFNPQVINMIADRYYTTGFEHYVSEGAMAGARTASHLSTAGTDYIGPDYLRIYEKLFYVSVGQLAKLRSLSEKLGG